MFRTSARNRLGTGLAVALLVAACGGGAVPATPTAAPATVAPPTAPPVTAAPTVAVSVAPTDAATGPANLDAVSTIEAGKVFQVNWTGPNARGDYVTIVETGATKWTDEDYFYTTIGTPGELTAPSKDGAYELWYVSGADSAVLARRNLTITPFQGSLLGPKTVMADSQFEVAWNGPNGPGDYVTIVKVGATKWTNESYFYTTIGSPGPLLAPLEPGSYELWYVIGQDSTVQSRAPLTVSPAVVTLDAPKNVAKGASFEVTWTGPNGKGDYVTIVPKGAVASAYESYFYTNVGSPGPLKAPDTAGDYEIRYIPGQDVDTIMFSIPIKVE